VLWELGVVAEFEVVSCASVNGTVAAANANARKILVFFMGKSPGCLYSGSEYLFTPTRMLLRQRGLLE